MRRRADPDAAAEPVDGDWSVRGHGPTSDVSCDRDDAVPGGRDMGVLWSYATAREIAALVAEDIVTGRIDRAHGDDLIGRVWNRAGPR